MPIKSLLSIACHVALPSFDNPSSNVEPMLHGSHFLQRHDLFNVSHCRSSIHSITPMKMNVMPSFCTTVKIHSAIVCSCQVSQVHNVKVASGLCFVASMEVSFLIPYDDQGIKDMTLR